MTDYVVKLRFWLRCWDSVMIDAETDADAIAMAHQVGREMMLGSGFPESIEADERREGLISYIDRIDAEGRNEIAEAVEFDGACRLFPGAVALISQLANLQLDDAVGEGDLRQLIAGFVRDARNITPDVPPRFGLPETGNR